MNEWRMEGPSPFYWQQRLPLPRLWQRRRIGLPVSMVAMETSPHGRRDLDTSKTRCYNAVTTQVNSAVHAVDLRVFKHNFKISVLTFPVCHLLSDYCWVVLLQNTGGSVWGSCRPAGQITTLWASAHMFFYRLLEVGGRLICNHRAEGASWLKATPPVTLTSTSGADRANKNGNKKNFWVLLKSGIAHKYTDTHWYCSLDILLICIYCSIYWPILGWYKVY